MSDVPPFDPDAGEPGYLWEAVAAHITARIEAGDLPPAGGFLANATLPPSTGWH
jgi:hypothetical protein